MIRFFNTLSGKLEELKPLHEGEVGMYTCGPTVYDYAHIGNFRSFVFEDLLRRFLEFKGFKVKHTMNLTDVDDKTIAGANRTPHPSLSPQGERGGVRGDTSLERLNLFTQKYIDAFGEDIRTLNILPANHPAEPPRATLEIPAMIGTIEKLIKKKAAYVSEGSVYYRVSVFKDYGRLSKKDLKGNIQGARVDLDEYDKEQGSDFALWKKARPGEPSWDSPWGPGRPGWHIECSVMSMKYLGETFDIHAGGEDLIFPHHENEIAQSEAATGKPFVHYWLHCKHLLVDGEKMSKSKGNFYTLRDLFAKGYDPMAIRYALLSVHYRQPLNFTLEGLEETSEIIRRLDDCYWLCLSRRKVSWTYLNPDLVDRGNVMNLEEKLGKSLKKIEEALDDDLNVALAISALFEGVKEINRGIVEQQLHLDSSDFVAAFDFFEKIDCLFGFDVSKFRTIPEEVMARFNERNDLRMKREFKRDATLQQTSDELRRNVEALGWFIKDGRPGEPSMLKKKRRAWELRPETSPGGPGEP